jgi:hypothetical protein
MGIIGCGIIIGCGAIMGIIIGMGCGIMGRGVGAGAGAEGRGARDMIPPIRLRLSRALRSAA